MLGLCHWLGPTASSKKLFMRDSEGMKQKEKFYVADTHPVVSVAASIV